MTQHDSDLAIIGMACRFPGATDLNTYWSQLLNGARINTRLSDEQLAAAGVDPAESAKPDYVRDKPLLADIDRFDAGFFGFLPREAELLDPGHRLFLETAWHALEHAGHAADAPEQHVGVFAGSAVSTYLINHLLHNRRIREGEPLTRLIYATDKDHLATRTAYKLDLKGPAVSTNTACSSSLVAVHTACRALLGYQCDMALAGGVAVQVPQHRGYRYQDGGMASPNGVCAAFDASAQGTVFADGVGAVVLKRWEDAVADGDTIYALIRGSAVNNDGADKVGYTAPSVSGQVAVIEEALGVAGLEPADIDYIEAHGTGTRLGDAVEVRALNRALGGPDTPVGSIPLGSVKTNIGHLDAAAGISGLIKCALALYHEQLPASLNFTTPNPEIDFDAGPFYVHTETTAWPRQDRPRRAGVSSFGLGGTNAHVILEQADQPAARPETNKPLPFVVSAKSEAALDRMTEALAEHARLHPNQNAVDTAFSLAEGRKCFPYRRAVIAQNAAEAAHALARLGTAAAAPFEPPPLVWLFSGQGAQYAGMAADLAEHDADFRARVEETCRLLLKQGGPDLSGLLLERQVDDGQLTDTEWAQPALFIVSFCLARWWWERGVRPTAMIGHSIGELAAACFAGVFSLQDGLRLVLQRARLMQAQQPGAMLAVAEEATLLESQLGPGLTIAAYNGRERNVVAGPIPAIDELATKLQNAGVSCRRLHTSHAFHTAMMEPALAPFTAACAAVTLNAPSMAVISNRTGKPLTAEQAQDPNYWAEHLRRPVRFAQSLDHVASPDTRYLEIGPGQSLQQLVAHHRPEARGRVFGSLPSTKQAAQGCPTALNSAAALWTQGVPVIWSDWFEPTGTDSGPRRIALPGYAFEPTRFWIEPDPAVAEAEPKPAPSAEEPPAAVENPSKPQTGNTRARVDLLRAELRTVLSNAAGMDEHQIDTAQTFLELGCDSLLLIQINQTVKTEFGVDVPFRRLFDDVPTIDALAALLDVELGEDVQLADPERATTPVVAEGANPALDAISAQLAEIARQVAALRGEPQAPAKAAPPPKKAPVKSAEKVKLGPYRPIEREESDELTPRQRAYLDVFSERYLAKTKGSRDFTQKNRATLADVRASLGYQALWKNLVYPLVIERAEGCQVTDLDGNRYIDMVMGFGVNLFGHNPAFVTKAVSEALAGRPQMVGPQISLMENAVQRFRQLTGMDRVTFCITGSEAVATAMRLARTATGRNRVALFKDSYHGNFDSVLVRRGAAGNSLPVTLGIPQHMVDDIVVLDYGCDSALQFLREQDDIAVVLVEPVQCRNPELEPGPFLRELRKVTAAVGTLLVFDEVVTGFRVHPGGAQAVFGVRADLATYGKIAGGGMPLGIVAGKAEYMDAIDGGFWQYDDSSFPPANQTVFAGTFCKHPLGIAAAAAVFQHLLDEGPALQETLAARTTRFAAALNAVFEEAQAPIFVKNHASIFAFAARDDYKWFELLFYHLRLHGVSVWGERPYFVSTAHRDEDLDAVVAAVRRAVADMQRGGFLPDPSQPERAPLTPDQRDILTACTMDPAATHAYITPAAMRLRGPLQSDALAAAFKKVVARHDALRTTVDADTGESLVHARIAAELTRVDLRDTPQRLADLLDREEYRAFDLKRGPLVRATLYQLAEEEHVLCAATHHLVCDGLSMDTLLGDLLQLYNQQIGRPTPPLPTPQNPAQYLAWLEAPAQVTARQNNTAYWMERFQDGVPASALPLDFPRPPLKTVVGARVVSTLEAPLVAQLKTLGQKQGASLFVTLAAAFKVLLYRLTGEDRHVIGVPVAGQALAGLDPCIGHFVHLVPLLSEPGEAAHFRAYLAALKQHFFAAHDHAQFRAADLKTRNSDPTRAPLINITFNLETVPGSLTLGDLQVEKVDVPKHHVPFELVVNAYLDGEQVHIEWDYNRNLFAAATLQRWTEHFRLLLEALSSDPNQPLDRLAMLTTAERRQLLNVRGDAAPRVATTGATLVASVEAAAARYGAATAVTLPCENGEVQHLDYAGLNRRANQLAHLLRAQGVGLETPVALCLERGPELIIAMLAVIKAGGCYLPLDPTHPTARLQHMVQDAQAPLCLSQTDLAGTLPANPSCRVLNLDQLDADLAAQPDHNPGIAVDPANLAYIIYTSGSTGTPKGVAVSHGNATRLFESCTAWFDFQPSDTWSFFHSAAFDFSVWEIWGALCHGARVLTVPYWVSRNPETCYDLLQREGVTLLSQTPSAFYQLLRAEENRDRLVHPRYLVFGGEALNIAALEPWFNRRETDETTLINMYGITETTVHVTYRQVTRADLKTAMSPIGVPLPDLSLEVLDAHGEPVPLGVAGELQVGGAGLARGYLNQPALTAQRFVPNPHGPAGARLYRSGDLAKRRADGELVYVGRHDHQVQLRGFRLELGEIEARLVKHPAVREAVVLLRDDATRGEHLTAWWVGDAAAAEELRPMLREVLPAYMVPAYFVHMEHLPRTGNDKIDRRALPDPKPAGHDAEAAAAQRTPAETTMAEIWASVLNLKEINIHDHFFDLGGDSIIAIQIAAKAKAAGMRLTPQQIFQHPTVAESAAFAATQDRFAAVTEVAPRPEGAVPLGAMQQRFFAANPPVPNYHHQSLMLDVAAGVGETQIHAALNALLDHHDALRLRFIREQGAWRQHYAAPGEQAPLQVTDCRDGDAAACAARLAEAASQAIHLGDGPLLQANLLLGAGADATHPNSLMVHIHHLAVDGVSWRILLEDLETLLAQQATGRSLQLPPRTASVKTLNSAGQTWADSPAGREERVFWENQTRAASALPRCSDAETTTGNQQATYRTSLDPSLTDLLTQVPTRRRIAVNDLLVTAVATQIAALTGNSQVVLDLEGHGRQDLGASHDSTRTVGWFTAMYPVNLTLPEESTAQVQAVAEALRAVPNGGAGYGWLYPDRRAGAEVLFNYLGRIDGKADGRLVRPRPAPGPDSHPDNPLSHPLEIDALINDGRLEMHWRFTAEHFRAETVSDWANDCLNHLVCLIDACLSETDAAPVMDASGLDADDLEKVFAEIDLAGMGEA
ncbi:non-ribosomal peptide synthetase/type I polyketide synthase [Acanthopleuribacter pedis]|uniref:Phenolphthiocerol/phthiocerol polyketide synthase subunit E n=1 Tax=Acanthopleuribacter pedis TaxID=442870 RepID=A0A8J7QCU2_9BACT|nr:non-ribosomal peptide synthetase/type I polyketide synthase [Acanthopleuribacter pedis]MBO1317349.1 amino acid adenylation domain-containing protein [Acanthopleuribacter pedis]MBO1318656.1 amino acid adenylation domain-containing protein [Acanthopleuribacter pedis]